ncbi:MAG: hypothetical protein M0D55_17080 [Elusimicrobiota bacterium]|nr:MAG: hypothetical protein M0D55_17080 [Elusimicrobiota bacterium]
MDGAGFVCYNSSRADHHRNGVLRSRRRRRAGRPGDPKGELERVPGVTLKLATATDGDEALHKLKENPFDLVFLDYRLPPPTASTSSRRSASTTPRRRSS